MLPKKCRKHAHTCLQLAGPRGHVSLGTSLILRPINPNARSKTWMRSSPLYFSSGSSRSKRHNRQQVMKKRWRRLRSLGSSSRIATTPAQGLHGLVVKLGLDRFLHEHADAASEQADSAYADLVRLTGHDPVSEILAKLRSSSRH